MLSVETHLILGLVSSKDYIHLFKSLFLLNKVVFLVLAHLEGVHVVNVSSKWILWFTKGDLDLLEGFNDVFTLLVS